MPHLGLDNNEVRIVDYDAAWPRLFQEEAGRILAACGGRLLGVAHVGSTAVLDLAAKPILDIMLGVPNFAQAESLVPAMEALGYEYLGTYGIEGRLFFRLGEPCTHHAHLVEYAGDFWRVQLLFRDYLRDHPETAEDYAVFKRDLAVRYAHDRPAYTAAKTDFIEAALERARLEGIQPPGPHQAAVDLALEDGATEGHEG
jgi:GrpB-like predicted nucleotidyltransferase (UPF0157 family)